MAEAIVLFSLACLAVTYAGYPLAVLGLAALRRPHPVLLGRPPESVSIIVCAHNEAASIGAKLDSILPALAGRSERIEIIVADDGSTDATGEIAARFARRAPIPVILLSLPRGGKAAALVHARAAATGEILVFSDADPLWETRTLAALLEPFRDSMVGAVAGEVRTRRDGRSGAFSFGDRLFRGYESAIRAAEDRLFGCVSADGGLFALRAALAEDVPPDVTDDFFLSTAAVAQGRRIAFNPRAAVHELSPPAQRQHLRRRIRITVRGLTGLWRRRTLLDPRRTGAYALGLLFHKLMRRLAPALLLPVWAASLWLALAGGGIVYSMLFAALSLAAACAALLLLLPLRVPRLLRMPLYLTLHVGGLAAGTMLFLAGRRYSQWVPQNQ